MTERMASSPDYFLVHRPHEPKREIGEYVRSHGIPVPLIDSAAEWREALKNGTAMVRSEHQQDYDGLPGIFDSLRLKIPDPEARDNGDILEESIRQELLQHDWVDPAYWLARSIWSRNLNEYYKTIVQYDIPKRFHIARNDWDVGPLPTSVSHWRYIPGLNITMFRDPHVDGRYYYGTYREPDDVYGIVKKSSGYVDAGSYDTGVNEAPYNLGLPARRLIELYEAVRTLPNFDSNHVPVIEMQLGDDDELYFLQYYKTRWQLDPCEAFRLPVDGIRVDAVRGVTGPEGITCRLYARINKLSETVVGQAVDLEFGNWQSLKQTFASKMTSIVLARTGVTLRGTHGARAMLYMPDVTIDPYGELEQKLNAARKSPYHDFEGNIYVNALITANGHEAVVDSDFKPIYEP